MVIRSQCELSWLFQPKITDSRWLSRHPFILTPRIRSASQKCEYLMSIYQRKRVGSVLSCYAHIKYIQLLPLNAVVMRCCRALFWDFSLSCWSSK
jgi:hypothetical protein